MRNSTETSNVDGQGSLYESANVPHFTSVILSFVLLALYASACVNQLILVGSKLLFQEIIRNDIRQEEVYDFVSCTTNGDCIALLGSKSELVTLELTSKSSQLIPFPYVKAIYKWSNWERPLDKLAEQVDLEHIYNCSNVLEAQRLSLEPVYTAICSQDVPYPCLRAVSWSPKLLPDGQMLLAALNSYGALQLLTKVSDHSFWHPYEKGLNIAATLRDKLQSAFEESPTKIYTFQSYQAFMDRSWITMFAWRSTASKLDACTIILGTAAGSLWTLTVSSDLRKVLAHSQLQTLLGRISYIHIHEDLLLVGDITGLIHLYRFDDTVEEGLTLIKPLWLRPDRMGLQQAVITHCEERDCYYIACCKAAHLLIWCMPRGETQDWQETRILVGGMKITALCALGDSSYAVGTASGRLYRIEVSHKQSQLCVNKQEVNVENSDNLQTVGLVCSPQKNLLTALLYRSKEYVLNTSQIRNQLVVAVGKLQQSNALAQLERLIKPNEPINRYTDLLADVRLEIFNRCGQEKYMSYAPIDMFAFDELATESQLQQLQLKYYIMHTLTHSLQHQSVDVRLESEMELLLAMLVETHIRLRLQYLSDLTELTSFQRKAVQCLFSEDARLRQQLEQQLEKAQPFNGTIKRFLSQMEVHFGRLQQQLGETSIAPWKDNEQPTRCAISYIDLPPLLEQHYCTLCDRQVLLEQELLLELYPAGSTLLCPYCHAAYSEEPKLD